MRPFSNMLGTGLIVWGRAKGVAVCPPKGGGEGGEYSLMAILRPVFFTFFSLCVFSFRGLSND